jgi:hypothetical protein
MVPFQLSQNAAVCKRKKEDMRFDHLKNQRTTCFRVWLWRALMVWRKEEEESMKGVASPLATSSRV